MARIIVTLDDAVLQEFTLVKERVSIGRGPHNDVVIDDIAVSAEHATIITNFNDSLLEDLNSTNGTQVNGQPVKKHFLQADDVIELARYKIRYLTDSSGNGETTDYSAVLRLDTVLSKPVDKRVDGPEVRHVAAIKVLNGSSAGKQVPLTKALTTIGKPGFQVAVIAYRPPGYCITHVEGKTRPLVNGQPIGDQPEPITHGDEIELSGTRMAFTLLSL
jgi:pSer/pThr/pTyr-binding forkhead associated (FHA) protein